MDTAELIVTFGGVFLVAFILWFFFGPKNTATAREAEGVQEVDVTVRGAYAPDRIEVKAGLPVRVNFRREEESVCTAEVIFPDFGIVKSLPFGKTTPVELTPAAPGEYAFHCGMNMVRGRLIAR